MASEQTSIHIRIWTVTLAKVKKMADRERVSTNWMLVQLIRLGIRYWDLRIKKPSELPSEDQLPDDF